MADSDLKVKEGGGGGGGVVLKNFFSALRASFWSKNKGGRAPPQDPPLYRCLSQKSILCHDSHSCHAPLRSRSDPFNQSATGGRLGVYFVFFFSKFCRTFNAHLLAAILYTKLASAPPAQGLEPWGQVWL